MTERATQDYARSGSRTRNALPDTGDAAGAESDADGIVFQSYALFPNLSVFDNVAYGLKSERRAKQAIAEQVAELLELVGMPAEARKYPAQLSTNR